MAQEIERKFLVRGDGWRALAIQSASIRQAYLTRDQSVSVRVRITDDRHARLTIKSREATLRRHEFEYEIALRDAHELLAMRSGAVIEKVRYRIPDGSLVWEIDAFSGANAGLVIAEIEIGHEAQDFEKPPWLGAEVTGIARYYNASLAVQPFHAGDADADSQPHARTRSDANPSA